MQHYFCATISKPNFKSFKTFVFCSCFSKAKCVYFLIFAILVRSPLTQCAYIGNAEKTTTKKKKKNKKKTCFNLQKVTAGAHEAIWRRSDVILTLC